MKEIRERDKFLINNFGVLPVKRTVKFNKFYAMPSGYTGWHFLCCFLQIVMVLNRAHSLKFALDAFGIVVINVFTDCSHQSSSIGESFAIIHFSLEQPPEAFHWTVINAMTYPGHALFHMMVLEPGMELTACILESAIRLMPNSG